MTIDRRSLLRSAGMLPLMAAAPQNAQAAADAPVEKADYTLRIATGLVELSPEHIVSTTLYNGQFPGPMVRLTEGKRVVVDIHNDTDTAEQNGAPAIVPSSNVAFWHFATFRWAAELGRYQSRADMAPTCCPLNSVANDPYETSAKGREQPRPRNMTITSLCREGLGCAAKGSR